MKKISLCVIGFVFMVGCGDVNVETPTAPTVSTPAPVVMVLPPTPGPGVWSYFEMDPVFHADNIVWSTGQDNIVWSTRCIEAGGQYLGTVITPSRTLVRLCRVPGVVGSIPNATFLVTQNR